MLRITGNTIAEITALIVQSAAPERIILFGSYARGEAGLDSDLDLLVVSSSAENRRVQEKKLRLLLSRYLVGKDILVYTPREVAEWKDVPGAFVNQVLKEGKTLYAKAA